MTRLKLCSFAYSLVASVLESHLSHRLVYVVINVRPLAILHVHSTLSLHVAFTKLSFASHQKHTSQLMRFCTYPTIAYAWSGDSG